MMRLNEINRPRGWWDRLWIFGVSVTMRGPAPDVLCLEHYRPELFGKSWNKVLQHVMRSKSRWTIGERELFATFTSKLNQCPY